MIEPQPKLIIHKGELIGSFLDSSHQLCIEDRQELVISGLTEKQLGENALISDLGQVPSPCQCWWLWERSYRSWRKSIFSKEKQDSLESPIDVNPATSHTHTHTHTHTQTHRHTHTHTHTTHSGCCVGNGVAEGEDGGREMSCEAF